MIAAAPITRIDPVLISLFLFFEFGRMRTNVLLKPRRLVVDISDIAEMSVVPTPIWSGVNMWVQMIQKKKPNAAITPVVSIK